MAHRRNALGMETTASGQITEQINKYKYYIKMPLCHQLTEIKYALQPSLAGLEEEQIQNHWENPSISLPAKNQLIGKLRLSHQAISWTPVSRHW